MVAVLRKIYGFMCRRTRGSPPTGFGCTGEVCTNSHCEKRAMHSTEEASKFGWWKCQNRSLTLVKKNSQVYCKQLAGSTLSAWLTFTPRRAVHGGTSTPLDPSTFTHNLVITNHFSDMESYQVRLHLQQF